MASRILVAALLASGALGRALPNGREVANVEAREHTFARGAVDTLDRPIAEPVKKAAPKERSQFLPLDKGEVKKRSPQEEGGADEGFSFGDYENQEDFWDKWDTEEAFFEEHAGQFESEDDFWEQLEAALPSEGGSGEGGGGEGFSFGDYESQEAFWDEWDTEEAFFEEHADQFENEDDFWEQLEAALPSEGSSSSGEGDAGERAGEDFPGFPGREEFPGFPGGDEFPDSPGRQ